MISSVTYDTEVGRGSSAALSEFVIGICAVGQEASNFGPEFCVLEEGPFHVDIEFRVKAIACSFDVKAFNPHQVDEAGDGLLAGFLFHERGFIDYRLEEMFVISSDT